MNSTVFFFSDQNIYRAGIIIAAAIFVAVVCVYLLWKIADKKDSAPIFIFISASLVAAPLFSRLVYWYCCYEQYSGIASAFFQKSTGGYSLLGAMIGIMLVAVILHFTKIIPDFLALLDCIAPAGAVCIAIGRLAAFFSADDKGKIIVTSPKLQRLPFAIEVYNESSCVSEWRFATFFFESLAGFAIFIAVFILFHFIYTKQRFIKGSAFFMFMSLFAAAQATLESTRYDSLFLRSNGFISLMQIASIIMLIIPVIFFSIKSVRSSGMSVLHIIVWVMSVLSLAIAAYLEYYVQRHADASSLCYPLMFICLLTVSALTFVLDSKIKYDPEQTVSAV